MLFANLTDIIEYIFMLPPAGSPHQFALGFHVLFHLHPPLNVSPLCFKVGIVSVLAFSTCGTAVADTDFVTVRPAVAFGVPGWDCGFSVVGATAAPSSAASPRGDVGDDGTETGNIGVARREGGREGCVGYDKSLNGVVLLYCDVC